MSQRIPVDRFLAAVKPRLERLQNFYRHAQFVGLSTCRKRGTEPEVMRHTYRSHGAHLRVDTLVVQREPSQRTWEEWSRVATPHMGFQASRQSSDSTFVLREFSRDSTKTESSIRWRFPFASSTYQYREMTLWEFLTDPLVSISCCELTKQDGENTIVVHCQKAGVAPQAFTFSVDKCWALIGHWIGDNDGRDHVRVTYEMVRGYPIIRRLEDYREYANGDVPLRTVVEVSDFIPAPSPLDYFDPSSLGIHHTMPTKDFGT